MTPFTPSTNIAGLRESATIAASARAKTLRAAGRGVIDLGAGEPDFPTPPYVVAAARRALDAGATRYTQVEGILPLRVVIAERASEIAGREVGADEVVVSTGTKQALFNACFSLFGAGDDVLVPTPGWASYYEMVALARARPVLVRGSREHQLKVTADDLARAASPNTRGLILNSPCNPTGAVYSTSELEDIVALAAHRGWWILSDEIYRAIAYGSEAPSVLSVAKDLERLVIVDGVAKSFAMTGWRIGWSIAPRALSRSIAALQSHTTSNAGTLAQHASLAALFDRPAAAVAIRTMVSALQARRDAALAVLKGQVSGSIRSAGDVIPGADGRAALDVIDPCGAFYLFVRVGDATADDPEPGTSFARRLLEEHDVAVVPGAAFRAPEWIRVSYAAPDDQVAEGVRRILIARIS